ncbi:ATP-binding protein [Sphingomonas ginsengisoli (ex An et al. 2013)]|nr:ATP-binding protein [Sphingomonas ginsengisoli An et al. 2013]
MGYAGPKVRDVAGWRSMIHAEDLLSYRETVDTYLNAGEGAMSVRFRFRAADSSWKILEGRGRIVEHAPGGAPLLFAGTITDLTEEAIREEKAQADHARLSAAQARAGAGVWEVDLRTGLIILDERSLEMHGLPRGPSRTLSQDEWAATLDGDAEGVIAAFRAAVASGSLYNAEYSTQGGRVWIQGFGSAVYGAGQENKPIKLVGLNLDVTERRKSERLIEEMRGELVQLARMSAMGSMASTIAHELNQPLAATSNYLAVAEMLLIKGSSEAARAAVQDATQAVLKAGDIIRRIREGLNKRSSERQISDLRPVIQSGIRLATIDAVQRDIIVEEKLTAGLHVDIDPVQIEQVIINLIRNSMDAIGHAEIRKIRITLREQKGEALVEVADTGAGIPVELQDSVFEAFSSNKAHGTGLGLSICRTIVESHEGSIKLLKSSPEGTVFSFRLPLRKSNLKT